jgi:nitrate reductase gamma subunit
MTLHRYIDRDLQMTPIDYQVTRSKVKVTVTKNVFTQWLPLQRTAHMGGMHVFYRFQQDPPMDNRHTRPHC